LLSHIAFEKLSFSSRLIESLSIIVSGHDLRYLAEKSEMELRSALHFLEIKLDYFRIVLNKLLFCFIGVKQIITIRQKGKLVRRTSN
jgi:3-dehydroquinate dehydratase